MSTEVSPEWARVILDAIEGRMLELNTGLPAKVVSFDPSIPSVAVQPLLLRVVLDDDNEVFERIPQITNVPVIYPGSDAWEISYPLAEGDMVFLAFVQRSIDQWLIASPGLEIDPGASRHHDLSDAVAIPGLWPRTSPRPTAEGLEIKSRSSDARVSLRPDGSVEINGSEIRIGEGASQSAVLGDALKTWLEGHTHPVSGALASPSVETAASAKSISGILSSIVKVK